MSSELIPPGSFERCWCTGVLRAQVIAAWQRGACSVDAIQRATGACSGCRTCRPEIEQLVRELAQAQTAAPRSVNAARERPDQSKS